MGFLQDILPIFKKREITLLEMYQESADVYTFIFQSQSDLHWKAGQHGIFTITHTDIKKPTRPFSVASAPTEKIIKITMEIGEDPSEFKKALLEAKRGTKMSMRGPIGPLYIKDNSPTLLIAGGIGITPFRAILQEIATTTNKSIKDITLLHIDSKRPFLYKEELDEMCKHTSIKITYLRSQDDLYHQIDQFTSIFNDKGQYYLAGSKSMVSGIFNYLKEKNISKRRIKKDVFIGYKYSQFNTTHNSNSK